MSQNPLKVDGDPRPHRAWGWLPKEDHRHEEACHGERDKAAGYRLPEAKELVHSSAAWSDVKAQDEEFQDSLLRSLDAISGADPSELATRAVDALLKADLLDESDVPRAVAIVAEEILIDPARVDAQGLTNMQRMQAGRPPIGPDGEPINLHHMLQTDKGPIVELTQTFHQENSKIININPSTIPSGIDRAAFDSWRKKYWKQRAATWQVGPANAGVP